MTALSDEKQNLQHFLSTGDLLHSYPVKANAVIYRGAMVCLGTDGYAVPAADTADFTLVGVATESVTGTASDGGRNVEVQCGLYRMAATSITQAMVGQMMYVVDDATIDDTAGSTNKIKAGPLMKYDSSTIGWVWISGKPLGQGIATTDVSGIAAAAIAATAAVAATQIAAADAAVTAVADTAGDDAALVNDLKAKYNASVTLINELKTDFNALQLEVAEHTTLLGTIRTLVNEVRTDWPSATINLIKDQLNKYLG